MNLLARVIDRGTATRSAEDIAGALDNRGVSLNIFVSRHLFSFDCTCLAEDFVPVMTLVGEILMSPSVPATELATRKGEVITAIRQDDDNPFVRAIERLTAMLYGEHHPYGPRIKGSIETVERLTRDELSGLHAARFSPSGLTAVIVGDVEMRRAIDVAAEVFGGWTREAPEPIPLPGPPVASPRRRVVIPMMNKVQVDIAYGFTSVARADPAYYACLLMNNVLGQYAMGGRLGDSIRERQGMAYYVSSSFDPGVIDAPLVIRAGVSPANVERAIASIDEELVRMRRDGVTTKELNESRQYLIGSMPRSLETNGGIASFLQTVEFFGLGLDYDVRLPALLEEVQQEEVNSVAARVLDPDRAAIAIAGPYADA